jgi:hypothetical protein
MTQAQQVTFADVLPPEVGRLHHGMCYGSDDQASRIAARLGWYTIGHPGYGKAGTANFHGHADRILDAFPYLTRNQHIVEAADLVIATPSGAEVVRSGTWATVRYARKCEKQLIVIQPDGTLL